jgi:hypothetical protein
MQAIAPLGAASPINVGCIGQSPDWIKVRESSARADHSIHSNLKSLKTLVQNSQPGAGKFENRLLGPTIQFFPTLSHCKRWFKNLRTGQESSEVVC